jgi:hypothetical protein
VDSTYLTPDVSWTVWKENGLMFEDTTTTIATPVTHSILAIDNSYGMKYALDLGLIGPWELRQEMGTRGSTMSRFNGGTRLRYLAILLRSH